MDRTHAGAAPEQGQASAISDATLREFAGYAMKRAINAVQSDLVRTLQPFGLRMITFTALTLVVDNPDLSQTQLAGALAMERSNLVNIVDDMETRGWITRNPAPGDRRSYALRATAAGERLCREAVDAVRAHEERLFAGLGTPEKAKLIAALGIVEQGNT